MNTWSKIIYNIIQKYSPLPITLTELYKILKLHPLVTAYHIHPWKPGGQPRYECWARRCLSNLVRNGRIKRVSRSLYGLN